VRKSPRISPRDESAERELRLCYCFPGSFFALVGGGR
jgi:hypothetical protein